MSSTAVIGGAGKTGQAILGALAARHLESRSLTRADIDLNTGAGLVESLRGCHALYALAPNFHPDEVAIAKRVVDAAREAGVTRVVFHSVLQPQLSAMPHHLAKSRAEEVVINSGLEWAILQPGPYAQNFTPEVVGALGYRADAPFSFVDLADVGQAAVRLLTDGATTYGIFEACGPTTSVSEVASLLGWQVQERAFTPSDDSYAQKCLAAMFAYYTEHGLQGSSLALKALLDREPTHAVSALKRR
ncbi:unannotated protein [freshwater metagenome]|uniref:Unannotated protein n=1 Tax=freshwater metagenome TaxID=449393 RepID=A0A6J6NE54_9ZZZZ|nr:NAD(P)H-binding protein [Actinomycetota bacterium]MSY51164.1 NAD(P)H-binding protein [Actinomycetota bacterium]